MKIVTLELYFPNNDIKTKELSGPSDAVDFINNNIIEPCLFDMYIDINDSENPYWQKTFSMQVCQDQDKPEVIRFITKLYENGFI